MFCLSRERTQQTFLLKEHSKQLPGYTASRVIYHIVQGPAELANLIGQAPSAFCRGSVLLAGVSSPLQSRCASRTTPEPPRNKCICMIRRIHFHHWQTATAVLQYVPQRKSRNKTQRPAPGRKQKGARREGGRETEVHRCRHLRALGDSLEA